MDESARASLARFCTKEATKYVEIALSMAKKADRGGAQRHNRMHDASQAAAAAIVFDSLADWANASPVDLLEEQHFHARDRVEALDDLNLPRDEAKAEDPPQ